MKYLKKRKGLLILLGMLAVSIIPSFYSHAAEVVKASDNATAKLSPNNVLTISGEGDLYDYEYNKSPWYNNTSIQKVIIEDGITGLGNCTFSGCTNLKEITFPDYFSRIGTHVFYNCGLETVNIPEGIESIETYTVTSIAAKAFKNIITARNLISLLSVPRI